VTTSQNVARSANNNAPNHSNALTFSPRANVRVTQESRERRKDDDERGRPRRHFRIESEPVQHGHDEIPAADAEQSAEKSRDTAYTHARAHFNRSIHFVVALLGLEEEHHKTRNRISRLYGLA
jgi:hypothetical protein